ncbi:amino acid adenylation domain-containing protein [Nonomuraea sp. K274]|uniref:Amino acid adenylation domain-containing protein n=1 Tax=Nonomuraea cypriaca TaxID=1187855 RepID=A0A931AIA4_9ACTN|nr:non-ribosomal peptide synthetase [Nonomuraea cypriaca]MBF8191544.1 amino acid adenylation domain-containing protein [Nonomuraea cypriaca]
MDMTALPLAHPVGGDRSWPVHRHPVAMPDGAARQPDRYAVAALAALIHRYTAESDLTIGCATGVIRVRVTADSPAWDLMASVAAAVPEPYTGQSCHASVAAAPDALLAPLTLLAREHGLELVMSRAEFDEEACAQYATHLTRVIATITADPMTAVRDIALLDAEETGRVLADWNQTDEPVPPAFFHEVIAGIAASTPDRIAVAWPGGRLTFRELDERANQLARRMSRMGVRPRSAVGVCFPRGPESLIAQLACFKLAAAAILLDPDFPADRIRYMIDDAAAVVTLTMRAHEDKVSGGCPVLTLDGSDWRAEPADPVSEPVRADDLIHICYTSGSTGAPKAVMVRHGACRNLVYSMRTLCGMTSESRGTWLAAPGYGMVEVECFSVLSAGAPVHIPEPSVVTSPEWLRDWFVANGITHTLLMKAMAERLWTLEWPAGTALSNIRICGERVQSWPSADLPFHVLNLYGSAEATVVAMCDLTELGQSLGPEERARRTPPIGRPTPNVKTYVLGDDMKPVPPGVIGELCVTGDSLSAGYLNRPEATAEKWIPNPIDRERHPLLYRSGDLARYWADGSIEIVGRTDGQVKVRGNRVHLGEIEVVLADFPGVRQAAVLAKKDAQGETRLVAYVEPESGAEPAVRQIRRELGRRLPAFMVPAAYVVGTFPTTTNGKIDRGALPEPPKSRPDVDTPYQEPRTPVERTLSGIWAELLDLEGIGVLDNFFELGGDSIGAARLATRICAAFEVEMELDELFDHASIEQMAAAIDAMRV